MTDGTRTRKAEGILRQQLKRLENWGQRGDNSLTMKPILFILTSFLITWPMACYSEDMDDAIRKFQQSLIVREITGSNVAMVYQDNKRLYHEAVQSKKEGDQNIDVNTLFPIWSMTKPITIVAMMKLHEQGKFDWNDPVFKYIPCFENLTFLDGNEIKPCHDQLRVIHLMTHRSGYRYYDSDPLPKGVPNYEAVHPNQSRYNDLETYVQAVAKQPLEFPPGTRYLYGINQAILGRLVEVLSGKDFETFLTDMIFTPLGMKDTSFTMDTKRRTRFQPLWINSSSLKGFTDLLDELTYSPDNKAHFGGEGLVSTMEDYARFCEMLVDGGVFRGKRIISEQSISTMTKKWSAAFPEEPNAEELLPGYVYGFSLFVLDDPSADNPNVSKGIYGWAGYHNTHFWIDPEKRMFGLFMSRAREFNWKIPLEFRKAVYGKKP